jgi:hypothetical protein
VLPIDDTRVEGSETVMLSLRPGPYYKVAGAASAAVTVADDDP